MEYYVDMQEKAMPIQGIQMRSQVMLNVASVILKGLRLTRYKQIYLVYSKVLLKKKGNKCKWLGKKLQRECKIYWKRHI